MLFVLVQLEIHDNQDAPLPECDPEPDPDDADDQVNVFNRGSPPVRYKRRAPRVRPTVPLTSLPPADNIWDFVRFISFRQTALICAVSQRNLETSIAMAGDESP